LEGSNESSLRVAVRTLAGKRQVLDQFLQSVRNPRILTFVLWQTVNDCYEIIFDF